MRFDGPAPVAELVEHGIEYRVQRLPQVYVLDQQGMIQFIGAPGAFVDLAVAALLAGK